MNSRKLFVPAFLAISLAASGFALAQGGAAGNTGQGEGGGDAKTYPAPNQNVEQNPAATGKSTSHHKHKTHAKTGAANDIAHTPGVDTNSGH